MEITEVRVALRSSTTSAEAGESRPGEKRLKAYVTLTFDHCFVVRNIKIIDGRNGLFVAMPSHRPRIPCVKCRFKTEIGSRFCPSCGHPMERPSSALSDAELVEGQAHRDIAHPITVEFRQYLQRFVLEAYEAERAKVGSPD